MDLSLIVFEYYFREENLCWSLESPRLSWGLYDNDHLQYLCHPKKQQRTWDFSLLEDRRSLWNPNTPRAKNE